MVRREHQAPSPFSIRRVFADCNTVAKLLAMKTLDPWALLLMWFLLLQQLEGDLLEKQLQVSSLQEISTHLLVKADEEDHIEAKEKVHVIENKLKLLLREVSQDMQTIQKKLVSVNVVTTSEQHLHTLLVQFWFC